MALFPSSIPSCLSQSDLSPAALWNALERNDLRGWQCVRWMNKLPHSSTPKEKVNLLIICGTRSSEFLFTNCVREMLLAYVL